MNKNDSDFFILLKYSQSTMLGQLLLGQQSDSYIYIYSFFLNILFQYGVS